MRRAGVGLALVLWGTVGHADTFSITACGQVVTKGRRGILMADLDCGAKWGTCRLCTNCFEEVAPLVACSSPADCPDPLVQRCYSDTGAEHSVAGVYVVPGARLAMNGHTIRNARNGVAGNDPDGVAGRGTVRVSGPGVIAATREGVTIGKGKVSNITARESVYGVVGGKVSLVDVTASDNVIGVSVFEKLTAKRLTADNNRYVGLLSYAGARVLASHLTGNVWADITTEEPPFVSDTTCDHSALLVETAQPGIYSPTGAPFGFCAQD